VSALLAPLRNLWQAWWHNRRPRSDVWQLTQRNIYILPTQAGCIFGLTLLTLLIASINYQLNLGYVLTFLLAGAAVVSMHTTHNTLRGLSLHLKPVSPVFAQEVAMLEVVLVNAKKARYGLALKVQAAADTTRVWVDVPAQSQACAHVSWLATQRGRHAVPTLALETRFPLGLFRAWTVWRPAAELLVYPELEHPRPALPASYAENSSGSRQRQGAGSEFEGVRGYRRGDALKLVIWKKAAQAQASGSDLVVRDATTVASQQLWLHWQLTPGLPTEQRLSRLAAWVVAAAANANDYGLSLPGVLITPGQGEVHRHSCLEALALYAPGVANESVQPRVNPRLNRQE
jgi:uncharacterized protein (DUF58 family)